MVYRIEYSKESGIILWLEAPCGFKQPIIRWADPSGVERFAGMLLDFYDRMMEAERVNHGEKDDEVKAISDNLLKQALGNDKEQTF